MSHHILPRPCTGTPLRPQLHLPQHPQSHPHSPYAPHYQTHHQLPHTTVSLLGTVYCHLSWRCHIKTPAWAGGMKDREDENWAQQIPAKGLSHSWLSLCHGHTSHPGWDPLEHSCGSWACCLSHSASASFCSRGKRAVVHQPGLAGRAQPPGRCHGRQDLRGLPAAPQEEISPPAQEVQPPPVTEPGILELAAKRPRLIRC